MKVPVNTFIGIVSFCLGILVMYGVQVIFLQPEPEAAANSTKGDLKAKADAMAKGKGGGPGGGGQNSKTQLAALVTKLDALTVKPLKFELSAEQKKQTKEILADLDSKEAITDEEAKEKLDKLLKLLESQKETMEAAGYRWPGQGGGGGGGGFGGGGGGGGGPPPPANPFKTEQNAARLKSLKETLEK